MKVLVIPSWYPSTDSPTAGVFIHQQVRALATCADVAVLHVDTGVADFGPAMQHEGDAVVVRTGISGSGPSARWFGYRNAGLAAFEELRATWGDPDIIHVQALWPAGIIARATKRRYGIPYVVTEHSEEYLAASKRRLVRTPGVVPLLLRPLAMGASRTIVVSRFLADRLVELGLAVDPVVIPNVVPVSDPEPPVLGTPHTIAHVSVMGPAKNLDGLLHAVAKLRERRRDFALRLVGDGECRAQLEVICGQLELGEIVEFTGRKHDAEVRAILAGSAFTVVSSTHETFSVSAAESLMCGRPVVSTRCGGPEEFIGQDVGRLVDVGSVDALVEGLDWMLDHFAEFEPEVLHRYALERFAPGVIAERILDVYMKVLRG